MNKGKERPTTTMIRPTRPMIIDKEKRASPT